MTIRRHAGSMMLLLLCLGRLAQGATAVGTSRPASIDPCDYAGDAAARSLWKPMSGTAEVSVEQRDGRTVLKMPCNFRGTRIDRASWDRSLHLDLTDARGVAFGFLCEDVSPVSSFVLYLRSGDGWYTASFNAAASTGWNTIRINKADTQIEGTPAGWSQIDGLRISAWRGTDQNTAFYLRDLGTWGSAGSVVIVRGESAAAVAPNELGSVCEYTAAVADKFDALGLDYSLLSDRDLTGERLKGIRLVILPHNPQMPDAPAATLEKYLRGGGKLMSFYSLPGKLQAATGITLGRHIGQKQPGQFASIRPSKDSPLADMPPSTGQASWNIVQAKPTNGRARVAADWFDSAGRPTGEAAILVSDNAVHMTHVLLSDDPATKRRLLLAMAGHLVPELWAQASLASVRRIGRMGPYNDLADARQKITQSGDEVAKATANMDQAKELAAKAEALSRSGQHAQAMAIAEEANQFVLKAASLVQKPRAGEYRAFWCHSAFGVAGMDWDHAIKLLADNGFTSIQVNMLWGGVAYYDSTVLPVALEVRERGDQIAQCLAACKKYGIQCHIWKVNFNMGSATARSFAERMKKEGRTQVDFDGKGIDDWLCPSHPENLKLEIDSLAEIAAKYQVDGVHLDYIRYPGPEGCFCAGCRERFEKDLGRKIARWPADVRQDEQLRTRWLDFRRGNITAVVAGISQAARKARVGIKVSAAVFPNWPADRDGVGQDWKLWCERGYLDFVCPMDYTPHSAQFDNLVRRQIQWAGKVPCYPGIGLSCWGNAGDVFTLFDQIAIARKAGAPGFTIFNYSNIEASEAVPLCGMGITRPR